LLHVTLQFHPKIEKVQESLETGGNSNFPAVYLWQRDRISNETIERRPVGWQGVKLMPIMRVGEIFIAFIEEVGFYWRK